MRVIGMAFDCKEASETSTCLSDQLPMAVSFEEWLFSDYRRKLENRFHLKISNLKFRWLRLNGGTWQFGIFILMGLLIDNNSIYTCP